MKAISIRPPWPWAILNGKPVENRTWRTKFKGPVLIHAGKKFDREGYLWILDHKDLFTVEIPDPIDFQMGGIVGKTNIIDCVDDHPSPFFFGPWGFVLEGSESLPFHPCKGALSFFNVEGF